MLECPWDGHDNSHDCDDYGKVDGAERMVRESIDDFCAGEDVEADKKNVVCQQHTAAEFIRKPAFPKDFVSEITDVPDMTITQIQRY